MAVIRDYYNGDCHIIVHDDFIRPPDEVKQIIDRVSELVINAEMARQRKARQENPEK